MRADQNPLGWPDGGSALPRPAGWTKQRLPVGLKFSMGFVALMALGMTAGAAWSFWTGQPATGVPLAFGAIYLGHVVGLGTRNWWTRRPSSRTPTLTAAPDGTTGVTFGYSAWSYYWLTAVLMMTELAALALTVALALSAAVAGVVTAVVLGVMATVVGWFLVTMLRLAPGRIVLSPAGVDHRSLTSTHFLPWHAIAAVWAGWVGTPIIAVRAFPSKDTRVRRSMGRFGSGEVQFLPLMVIRTGWLATDPSTVYHALSFYHAHPELQAELATPEALDRISNGRAVRQEEP
ncbi:MAG TPA: hypothetical protein VF486_20135 [Actinomycetes bacterium]